MFPMDQEVMADPAIDSRSLFLEVVERHCVVVMDTTQAANR